MATVDWSHEQEFEDGAWLFREVEFDEETEEDQVVETEYPAIADPRTKMCPGVRRGFKFYDDNEGRWLQWATPISAEWSQSASGDVCYAHEGSWDGDTPPERELAGEYLEEVAWRWTDRVDGLKDGDGPEYSANFTLGRRTESDDPVGNTGVIEIDFPLPDGRVVPAWASGQQPTIFGGVRLTVESASAELTILEHWEDADWQEFVHRSVWPGGACPVVTDLDAFPMFFAGQRRDLKSIVPLLWRAKRVKLSMTLTGESELITIPQ